MAAHNSGGKVIAQARRLVARGSLPPRRIKVPGALIDLAYLDPEQTQTYLTGYSPFYAGQLRTPTPTTHPLGPQVPLDIRKAIARRSLLEFRPGDICNLGFGISQSIGAIAAEEGVADRLVLTVEQGVFGGVPAGGQDGGAGVNQQAIIDQPSMFDFYDGGGLDVASLSFAEVDAEGNVNVHAFEGRLRGPGGFPNISARTRRLCFVGTFTAGGFSADLGTGRLVIEKEGSTPKFVPKVREVTFSARMARLRQQQVRYITERAVFSLEEDGVTLIEVADGIDVEHDVIAHMGFRPHMGVRVGRMDPRIFAPGLMGLASDFDRARE
jgi:propionate CoA-transferase